MMSQPNSVGRFMVAVGAVIELAGTDKILIIQRSAKNTFQPLEWELVYGRVAQFEEPPAGLKREVKEEIGLEELEIKQILSVWHIFRGETTAENELIGITYYCTTTQEQIELSDEHTTYQWVTPQTALQLIKVRGIQKDIEKYLAMKAKTP